MVNDGRGARKWSFVKGPASCSDLKIFIRSLSERYKKAIIIWPHSKSLSLVRQLVDENGSDQIDFGDKRKCRLAFNIFPEELSRSNEKETGEFKRKMTQLSHLDELEANSIHIMREVVAEADNPVMLYSIGKDSSVMLRLAQKAFYPSKPPFPLLHVDTRWKFKAMYEFREKISSSTGMNLIVHINPEGIAKNINPFDHGSALHTDIMKTQGLKQALDKYGFDAAFGGARRDEEMSRAKERVFSFRNISHQWDPKTQRPELWNLYNGRKNPGESLRVFPLSDWTELDIWQYIFQENIPIVPLYFAAERPVISRDGMLMLVDDERLEVFPDEKIENMMIRFRTLGCYPLTGAIESEADNLSKILLELLDSKTSERQGRAIDTDVAASMEKKKQEGYF
jgi:sulfate adenylyltransferase subunit 2